MGLGQVTGCRDLQEHASMYAFHNFSSSMVDDYASFLELSEECVVSLLQNEHLQVSCWASYAFQPYTIKNG